MGNVSHASKLRAGSTALWIVSSDSQPFFRAGLTCGAPTERPARGREISSLWHKGISRVAGG
jgi:hypothetical protein